VVVYAAGTIASHPLNLEGGSAMQVIPEIMNIEIDLTDATV